MSSRPDGSATAEVGGARRCRAYRPRGRPAGRGIELRHRDVADLDPERRRAVEPDHLPGEQRALQQRCAARVEDLDPRLAVYPQFEHATQVGRRRGRRRRATSSPRRRRPVASGAAALAATAGVTAAALAADSLAAARAAPPPGRRRRIGTAQRRDPPGRRQHQTCRGAAEQRQPQHRPRSAASRWARAGRPIAKLVFRPRYAIEAAVADLGQQGEHRRRVDLQTSADRLASARVNVMSGSSSYGHPPAPRACAGSP